MTANLDRVFQNFEYWMGELVPTEQELCRLRFEKYDPFAHGAAAQGGGNLRKFWLEPKRGDPDSAATDTDRREAFHEIHLHVEYPRVMPITDLNLLWARDLHDIREYLRDANQDHMKGYDGDNTTTDIGLYIRTLFAYDIDRQDPDVWRLSMGWRCKIRESEI